MYRFPNLNAEQMAAVHLESLQRNTNQHLSNLKRAEEIALQTEQREAENRSEIEKILAENERQRVIDEQNLRAEAAKNLEIDLKSQFMRANPDATETTWMSVKADVLKEFYLERMRSGKSIEDQERARYSGYRL